jgi:hypothetical protein
LKRSENFELGSILERREVFELVFPTPETSAQNGDEARASDLLNSGVYKAVLYLLTIDNERVKFNTETIPT